MSVDRPTRIRPTDDDGLWQEAFWSTGSVGLMLVLAVSVLFAVAVMAVEGAGP